MYAVWNLCSSKTISLPTPSKVSLKFQGRREGFEKPIFLKEPLSSGWGEVWGRRGLG